MKKLIDNYKKPTPAKWRKIGDTCLLAAIAVEPMVQSMPLADEAMKAWIAWTFSTALILLKFWSNTHTHQPETQQ